MQQKKWLKLSAATFLSVGMLAACGDDGNQMEMDPDEEVDTHMDPNLDEDTDPED